MEELIKKIAAQVGITEEQAKAAVNHTMSYLKSGDALKETFADWKEDASETFAELQEDAAEKLKEIQEGATSVFGKIKGMFDGDDDKKEEEKKA
jgi:predicted transcriptional regulator